MVFAYMPQVAGTGLMILVHTSRPPSDAEWETYFAQASKQDPRRLKNLVFTDGGAPSSAQRKQVNDWLAGQPTRACVITASPLARGAVKALSWFNPQLTALAPDKLEAAFEYLGVRPEDRAHVRTEIKLLRVKLGSETLKCIAVDP
jgi:hypothetical protein